MTVSGTSLIALSQALDRVDQAAAGLRSATGPRVGSDDQASLSAAVRLLVAKRGYESAIELAKTADEMSRHAIDLLA